MLKVIEVKNLSKKFRIYQDRSPTLKERLLFWGRQSWEELQVLNHISFSVEKGDAVALIGRNGSGKSTLLKVLTGILSPDQGSIKIAGRISSLLELGAGFHPDFTGRENIYLNASIFGLSRREINRQLNSIIDFSELGDFIDNPVRNYSSGMYMRLGFSVAVHVDPEILLIDEVLAVGDVSFQKKCLEKIDEFRQRGKTIIIVSHDLAAIEKLCNYAIWLEGGDIRERGRTRMVLDAYLGLMTQKEEENALAEHAVQEKSEDSDRWGSREIEITEVRLFDQNEKERYRFDCGERVEIRIGYQVKWPEWPQHRNQPEWKNSESEFQPPWQKNFLQNVYFGLSIFRSDGVECYGTDTRRDDVSLIRMAESGSISFDITQLPLLAGKYYLDLFVHGGEERCYDYRARVTDFHVAAKDDESGIGRIPHGWRINGKTILKEMPDAKETNPDL